MDVVVVPAGGVLVAVPASCVSEVVALPALEPVAASRHGVVGLLRLRGAHVPVVDLRVAFGLRAERPPLDSTVVIVDVDGERTGLLGDGLGSAVLGMPVRSATAAEAGGAVTGTGPSGEQVVDVVALIGGLAGGGHP